MPTAVVTGANSGIGHAFAQVLLREGYDLIATDIQLGDKIKGLGCEAVQLDVSSPDAIQRFKERLGDRPIDLLLNIAGVYKSDTLMTVTHSTLLKTFDVNAFGPLLLTQALLPNLLSSLSPRIGCMSSRVGSIADNTSGGNYAYRSSKAALNSICKSMSVDLRDKGVVVVIMHPGYVRTALDPSTHGLKEAVEPEEAAEKLFKVLMDKGIDETGKFWHREGFELEW